ncbi:MAG: hypothetical protein QW570_08865 [Candidatus Caldarchaeum sp.]
MIWRTGWGDWYYSNEGILWVIFWDYGRLTDVMMQYFIDDLTSKVYKYNETEFRRRMAFNILNGDKQGFWLRLEGE